MALLRKLFYKKPPDGLLEISERIYGNQFYPLIFQIAFYNCLYGVLGLIIRLSVSLDFSRFAD